MWKALWASPAFKATRDFGIAMLVAAAIFALSFGVVVWLGVVGLFALFIVGLVLLMLVASWRALYEYHKGNDEHYHLP
jgi:hypothetical protein